MSCIVIIGKDACPNCKNTKNFLDARNIKYEYKSVPEDLSYEEACEIVGSKFMSFPQIKKDDVAFSSFEIFRKHIISLS